MKNFLTILLFISSKLICQTPNPATDPNFYLYWSDEFDGTSLNTTSKWNIMNWVSNPGEYKEVICTNRTENIEVTGGELKLSATDNDYLGHHYTVGLIQSKPQFTIGCYFETYSKIQNSLFSYPAIWPWAGSDAPGPGCNYREIDIMEYEGSIGLSTGNLHYCRDEIRYPHPEVFYYIGDLSIYHKYGCLWDSRNISIVLDSKNVIERPTIYTLTLPMNIMIGEGIDFTSNHTPGSSNFPIHYNSEYIRVYKLKTDHCNDAGIVEINFGTYVYELKKSIKLSGATTIPTSGAISLRAVDFIELFPGFEVLDGADLSLNTNPCDN